MGTSCAQVDCSGHGMCDESSSLYCLCEEGWDPVTNCSSPRSCSALSGCSGHGICVKGGSCACDPGWSGPRCAVGACESPFFSWSRFPASRLGSYALL
jgi:hypothetical protein